MHCPSGFLHLFQHPSLPLIYFPPHLIVLMLGSSAPPIFYLCLVELSFLSLSPFRLDTSRHQTFTSMATTTTLTDRSKRSFAPGWQHATVRLSGVTQGGSLEFKGEWDLGVLGPSDEVNRSAETDSRQNQVSVQIPACSDPSTPDCLETSKTFRNSKSCWCSAISLYPLSSILSVSLTHTCVYTFFDTHEDHWLHSVPHLKPLTRYITVN